MNLSYAKIHLQLFAFFALLVAASLAITFHSGTIKPGIDIDYYDAFGEGGMVLMTLIWLVFTLLSRPAGRVTNLLFVGLSAMHLSILLDFLDEFLAYPENSAWLTTVESLPAPIGMVIMSFALYHWHSEQMAMNDTLYRRERYYREHRLVDIVTGLYSVEYMKAQINREIALVEAESGVFSLIMFDVKHFDKFNQRFGYSSGDNLLEDLAYLLLLNLRRRDLVCRFASDRFIVLLPHTSWLKADEIARQVNTSIEHLAHKPGTGDKAVYQQMHYAVGEFSSGQTVESLMRQLSDNINRQKSQKVAA